MDLPHAPTPGPFLTQLIRTRNLDIPFVPPNKELAECQPDYDNDNIRIERSHLHGHMEDGLRDHGITARSRESGAGYF